MTQKSAGISRKSKKWPKWHSGFLTKQRVTTVWIENRTVVTLLHFIFRETCGSYEPSRRLVLLKPEYIPGQRLYLGGKRSVLEGLTGYGLR